MDKKNIAMNWQAELIISEIVEKGRLTDRYQILEAICDHLEQRFSEDELEKNLAEFGFSTTKDILIAIDEYLQIKEEAFNQNFELPDGAMRLVEEVIVTKQLTDRVDILKAVYGHLENKYQGKKFENYLNQLNFSHTTEILRAIDIYLIIHNDFPNYTFRRKSRDKTSA